MAWLRRARTSANIAVGGALSIAVRRLDRLAATLVYHSRILDPLALAEVSRQI
jgi:hypothetical protein